VDRPPTAPCCASQKALPDTQGQRSKDQSSLANHLLLMPHPIIHSQASNPGLLHTVNNKQPGAVPSYAWQVHDFF